MFKLNQKVWSFVYGWGVIERIIPTDTFPIKVYFDTEARESYTEYGVAYPNQNQTLFHDEVIFKIPSEPKPDLKKGDPLIVGGEYRRYFSHWEEDKAACFENGLTEWTSSGGVRYWGSYRLPTEEELGNEEI